MDLGFVLEMLKDRHPSPLVAGACYRLVEKHKKGNQIDHNLSDTDRVHLGYALAYKPNSIP